MDLQDIKRRGDAIQKAMQIARGLEQFYMEHAEHPVRFEDGVMDASPRGYCALCRFLWTPEHGAEPVRFDGSSVRPDTV